MLELILSNEPFMLNDLILSIVLLRSIILRVIILSVISVECHNSTQYSENRSA